MLVACAFIHFVLFCKFNEFVVVVKFIPYFVVVIVVVVVIVSSVNWIQHFNAVFSFVPSSVGKLSKVNE